LPPQLQFRWAGWATKQSAENCSNRKTINNCKRQYVSLPRLVRPAISFSPRRRRLVSSFLFP
jgi:hypothetical protein